METGPSWGTQWFRLNGPVAVHDLAREGPSGMLQPNLAGSSAKDGTVALALSYGTVGVFWGAWAVAFADVLRADHLSVGQASIGLGAFGVTALLSMALVRPLLHSAPRRASISLALVVFALGCLLLVLAPAPSLIIGFGIAGVGAGVGDVAINAAGNQLEERSRTAVLQWVHGGYSAGAVLGAGGAGMPLPWDCRFEPCSAPRASCRLPRPTS